VQAARARADTSSESNPPPVAIKLRRAGVGPSIGGMRAPMAQRDYNDTP